MVGPHLALFVPEIILEIFEQLSAKGVVVAALVCKAWSGPAVDTKWRTQKIMLSRLLARLAPIGKDQHGCAVLVPKTLITQDRWSRFLAQYANQVTSFVLNMEFDETSYKLISALLKQFSGVPGNNLRSLSWFFVPKGRDGFRKLIGLLHGTRLQEVNLPPRDQALFIGPSLSTSLSQLVYSAPQILELHVYSIDSFDFSVFSQLRFLRHGGQLSISDFHNLSHCTHLQTLLLDHTGVQVGPG
ncbi:hypothetical protein FRB93_013067 [Tulasnella sp. JGI-2019a]|nr:hypothetical protein FRB93_013067 [Tulasnella sp. JGI-2019a]